MEDFLRGANRGCQDSIRLVPLLICTSGLSASSAQEFRGLILLRNSHFITCFVINDSVHFLVVSSFIILYQLIIYPCFYNYIPSMLKRIGSGLLFALFTVFYYIIIFASKESSSFNTTSYKAVIILQILYGIAFAFILPTSLEFTIAQSPHKMRGLMISLWFAAYGLGYAISIGTRYPFQCERDITCQSLYYYVFKGVIILIIMILFIVLSRNYKLRVRDNEVSIHWIAEEHYAKYIEQENEYRREV